MLIVIVEYNWITLNHLHSHWSLAPSSLHPQPLRKKKKHSGFHTLLPSKLQEPFSCAGGVSGAEPPIGENTKQRPWTLLVTPRSSSPPGKCPAVKVVNWSAMVKQFYKLQKIDLPGMYSTYSKCKVPKTYQKKIHPIWSNLNKKNLKKSHGFWPMFNDLPGRTPLPILWSRRPSIRCTPCGLKTQPIFGKIYVCFFL